MDKQDEHMKASSHHSARPNVFSDTWRAPQQSPREQNVFLGLLQRFHYKVCVLAGAEIGLYHQWDHVMRFKGSVRGQEWHLQENRADHYKGAEKKKITWQAKMEPFLNPSQLSDASIWPRADRKVLWRGRQKKNVKDTRQILNLPFH